MSVALSPALARSVCAWLDGCGDYIPMALLGKPPWGSKENINRAGESLRKGEVDEKEAMVLEAWRNAHNYILNTFQAILRQRTRGKGIVVAQRLKRRTTIVDKLSRENSMRLARMDDIAGCRLIFPDYRSLDLFRAAFHRATFKHKRKNHPFKYHYIKQPRASGYRGIHDIYEYNTTSPTGARLTLPPTFIHWQLESGG
jgi:putative GTP pyrophosphokinase